MTPERIDLGSGVALNLLPCDSFKTNCLSVTFLCPMDHRSAAENALLPFVLKRGTQRLPTMTAMTRELEMLYGSHLSARLGKVGDTQFFGFQSNPLRDSLAEGMAVTAKVLSLIGEMIYQPWREDDLLSSAYIEGEKRVLMDAVRSRINHKGHYALLRCREEMCRNDPCALPETGTEEQIAAITAASLTRRLEHARLHYPIEIWFAGVVDREALIAQVKEIFLSHPREPIPLAATLPFTAAPTTQRITEDQPIKQGTLCLGFGTPIRSGHALAPAYSLMLEVLSGSPTAKLFVNVREKQSLCYYCTGIPDMQKGILIVASGIEVSQRDQAEQAILQQVDACRRGEITEEEMTAAKKALATAVRSMYDDPAALISWYFKHWLIGSTESPLAYDARLSAVTRADLVEAARSLTLDTVYFLNGTLPGEEEDDG